MKRCKGMLTSLALVLTCCACNDTNSHEQSQTAAISEQRILVTLGDSIAAGYGLEDAENTRYSALITKALSTENMTWKDYNYAVSGDTAAQLMERLNNGRAVRLPSADAIVISIGANNMLQPFGEFYGVWLQSPQDTATLVTAFTAMESAITAGLADFETELPNIYNYIRDCNTEGQIILQTIYNPFANIDMEIDLGERNISLAEYADAQIGKCNDIITSFIAKQNDTNLVAADIYAAFDAEDAMPIIGTKGNEDVQYLDPHPTAKGHKIIATVIEDIIQGATE